MSLKSQTPAEGWWVLECCHPATLLLKSFGHEKTFVLLRPLAGLQGLEVFPHPSQWERTFSVLQVREQDEEKSSLYSRIPAHTENVKTLNGWQWKKHVLCELSGRRYLSIALMKLHMSHNPSWVTVSSAIYYVTSTHACDFICSLCTAWGLCAPPSRVRS